jgi:hypothetical protein
MVFNVHPDDDQGQARILITNTNLMRAGCGPDAGRMRRFAGGDSVFRQHCF